MANTLASLPVTPIALAGKGAACPPPVTGFWPALGEALRRYRPWILGLQWLIVLGYAALLIIPAALPLPAEDSHLWNDVSRFAQFAFWGLWWPGVMVATVSLGRVWCGVLCPEGALSEWASRHGRGLAVPRWMKWSGWPLFAFLCTTTYGQLISVYEYPKAALLILGGSTLAAIAVGLVYGKGSRVWCRHLCPANGVFALLAKIAPLHYRVDRSAWEAHGPAKYVSCAPLVDIRRMKGAADCHACGQCSGHRGSVWLTARKPWAEILDPTVKIRRGDVWMLLFGVLGIATMAFQWSSSPILVDLKMTAANWLLDHGHELLLQSDAPWWLLTHFPEANDVFTWLDGAVIVAYLLIGGGALGMALTAAMAAASWLAGRAGPGFARLTLALVPMGAASVILGLSMLTISHLKAEHVPLDWLALPRIGLLVAGSLFSLFLASRLTRGLPLPRRLAALGVFALALALVAQIWVTVFFVW